MVELSGVEQEDAGAEGFEIMFDFEVFKYALLREDFFQQISEFRNIPLAVA